MEKQITIKTKDNHLIYGTLNWRTKKSKNLIVFVHGLTGNQNEHHYYNAARFFPKKGFATFRFDLYSDGKSARVLRECGVSTHVSVTNEVLRFLSKRFSNIVIVGHSLGGLVVLLSDMTNVKAGVLWDPALIFRHERDDIKYQKHLKAYVITWNMEILMGKRMYEEWANLPDIESLLAGFGKPLKIICAGNEKRVLKWTRYIKRTCGQIELVKIEGADHCFNPEGTEEALFKETLKFVKRFAK